MGFCGIGHAEPPGTLRWELLPEVRRRCRCRRRRLAMPSITQRTPPRAPQRRVSSNSDGMPAPTIIASFEDGPLAGETKDAEVLEGRPPKTLDVSAEDGTTCRYCLRGRADAERQLRSLHVPVPRVARFVCGFTAGDRCSTADVPRPGWEWDAGMRKLLQYGGIAASVVLIAFGIGAI